MEAKVGNPFIVGPPVPPSKFIGRKYEVNTILSRLANPYNQGGSAIHGGRRIGKTSLLHYVRDPLSHGSRETLSTDHCRFVYLDSHALVLEMSEAKGLEKSFWTHVFDHLTAGLGERAVQLKQAVLEDTLTDFQLATFFQQLGENGYLVVVLLDEFDVLMEQVNPEDPRFFYRLRTLLNQPAPRGFSLVVASWEPLYVLFQDVEWRGSEFYNNLAMLPLDPFAPDEVKTLLEEYLKGTGIELDQDKVWRDSRGHPQKVQEIAFALFSSQSGPPKPVRPRTLSERIASLFDPVRRRRQRHPRIVVRQQIRPQSLTQKLSSDDRDSLIRRLSSIPQWQAGQERVNVLLSTGLPEVYVRDWILNGAPDDDAAHVINDLGRIGHVVGASRYTALGLLVKYLHQKCPDVEGRKFFARIVINYQMTTDQTWIDELRRDL